MSKWSIGYFVAVALLSVAMIVAGCAMAPARRDGEGWHVSAYNFEHCGHEYIMLRHGDVSGFVHDPDCSCYAASRALPMPSPYGNQE